MTQAQTVKSRKKGAARASRAGASVRAGKSPHGKASGGAVNRWSKKVTETSDAMDLESGVFTRSPKQIARSLKRSAEKSGRRKSTPFRSAMSMLTFYENRAGKHLDAAGKARLERAKDELRALFHEEKKS